MKERNSKQKFGWQVLLGIVLVGLSAVLYFLDYSVFHDKRGMFNYMLLDTAFVPIEVLLVTLIISGLLSAREKKLRLKKMNMAIGVFFSEAGTRLVKDLNEFTPDLDKIRSQMMVDETWTDAHFSQVRKMLSRQEYRTDSRRGDLVSLRSILLGKRGFLMGLLENPNLLEHETFTELLWAVFHLADELATREDVRRTGDKDQLHLSSDMRRAYHLLLIEWLAYMQHLKQDYPYLFSLAVRMNPFNPNARVEVTQ